MEEDETGQDFKLPHDSRLESLDRRLEQMQQAEAKKTAKAQGDPNMRVTQRVIGYLIGGPLGGGLFGWGLDSLFDTMPWLTIVMLFLGFGVGIRNVLKLSKSSGSTPGAGR